MIAFFCGTVSASTKFCAKAATSTPEPALSDVKSFCAADRLAAAVAAATLAALLVVAVLAVLVEETAVVAMVLKLFKG